MKMYNDEKFPTSQEIEIMNLEFEKLKELQNLQHANINNKVELETLKNNFFNENETNSFLKNKF